MHVCAVATLTSRMHLDPSRTPLPLCVVCASCVQAGAVVQQSLSQIRTVAAYNGEAAAANDYDSKLDVPQKVSVPSGGTEVGCAISTPKAGASPGTGASSCVLEYRDHTWSLLVLQAAGLKDSCFCLPYHAPQPCCYSCTGKLSACNGGVTAASASLTLWLESPGYSALKVYAGFPSACTVACCSMLAGWGAAGRNCWPCSGWHAVCKYRPHPTAERVR